MTRFASAVSRSLLLIGAVFFAASLAVPQAAQAQRTTFSYQGYLEEGGAPAQDDKDLRFALYDSQSGGSQVGQTITKQDVGVADGVFNVEVDFGAQFAEAPRYLDVGVRDASSSGSFTTLSPREVIRPAPIASSLPNVTGDGSGNVGIGTTSPGSRLTVDGPIEATSGGITFPDGTTQNSAGVSSGDAWSLGGNSGLDPSTGDYLGTSDETPLEFKVNGERALRIEPTVSQSAPNVIGGHSANAAGDGVVGATIGGGGFSSSPFFNQNNVDANFGTVSGGLNNSASGEASTIGGGGGNVASGDSATVAGGRQNEASGTSATVGGGANNRAEAKYATVVGGFGNTASGFAATAMGEGTTASGQIATTMGTGTEASASVATAMGWQTTASGRRATAMGRRTTASGQIATAMGFETIASGNGATAMGLETTAATNASLSLGQYNAANTSADNTLLAAGNGSGSNSRSDVLVLKKDGDLAVGPSDPQDLRLHVTKDKANAGVNDDPRANMVLFENTNDGTRPDVLGLQAGPTDPGSGVTYISFYQRDGTTIGGIEGNGSGGINYQTSGSDYAEELPMRAGSAPAKPTDLVAVRGGAVSLDTDGAQRLMIVTDRAAVTGNVTSGETRTRVPVAFVGHVPVQLTGIAKVGDLIVASGQDDGTARAVSPEQYRASEHGPIAGRAWSAKPTSGPGTVTVAVGLDQSGALAEQLRQQRQTIRKQNAKLQSQEEKIDALEERLRRVEERIQK